MVFALVLSGCASRPTGVLVPSNSTVPDASRVDLLVATTRAPTSEPGVIFSGERGSALSLLNIGVSIPPENAREVGQVQWPSRLPANPAREFATLNVTPLAGQTEARQWLSEHLPANRRVLIFVHGFNNRFDDAVYRFAQIVHDSGADVAPILFTWPSRARVFDYLYDRESTNFSRDGLETLLRTVIADRDVGEITVLAHSMGAWPVMEVLRQMAIKDGRIDPKLRNVILASPDIDSDVFATQWRRIPNPRPEVFLFTSQRDRALGISRRISGNVTRLGEIDPAAERYRAALEESGIVVLDLSGMSGADRLHHGKFADNPEIIQLIGNRLIAGQLMTDSEASLGERISGLTIGLGKAVGGVAGATISAPLAVIDPNTRRTYGEQIEQIGLDLQAIE
ncbi:alpha/beta hydrolase [Aureimonas fodinaquatilis]|nr:alpha/beta hydrolase [Aureimonas fodinaquatilis]